MISLSGGIVTGNTAYSYDVVLVCDLDLDVDFGVIFQPCQYIQFSGLAPDHGGG
jgi:hypothetical protein